MEYSLPYLILLLVPIIVLVRFITHQIDTKTKNIRKAISTNDLTFSNFQNGFQTASHFYRFLNSFIFYASALSIGIHSLISLVFVTLVFVVLIFLINKESRVFSFYQNSIKIEHYISFMGAYYEFQYSEINRIDYLIGSYGSNQLKIHLKNGAKKKIPFRPNIFAEDQKLIQLILNEKTEFTKRTSNLKDVVN